jgi:hypothetical protein
MCVEPGIRSRRPLRSARPGRGPWGGKPRALHRDTADVTLDEGVVAMCLALKSDTPVIARTRVVGPSHAEPAELPLISLAPLVPRVAQSTTTSSAPLPGLDREGPRPLEVRGPLPTTRAETPAPPARYLVDRVVVRGERIQGQA